MRELVFADKTQRDKGVIHTCFCVQVLIYMFQISLNVFNTKEKIYEYSYLRTVGF